MATLETFWHDVTGWYTPGWGNLFTVGIAAAAIAVNAWYNRRTLRSANEKFEQNRNDANEKFRQGRVDARNDKLRAEIADFLEAISERKSRWSAFTQRIVELDPQAASNPTQFGLSLRAAWYELLSDSYTRIGIHSLAIEILTDDPGIIDPLRRIVQIGGAERQQFDTVLDLLAGLTSPADASRLQVAVGQLLVVGRGNVIDLERQALVDYVMGEWAQQNR
jgi:hypothetical protein